MKNDRVRNLTLASLLASSFTSSLASLSASLLVVSACAGGANDDGELVDLQLAAAEAMLSPQVCPDDTPAELAPAEDQDLAFVLDATGVQKYSCNATCNGAEWTFVAPEADLFERHRLVGTHYAGPTWEYEDGSTVVAAVVAGATLDATAIPWVLLSAVSHGDIVGEMTEVTAIQRLETTGGLAPATGCDVHHLGATADVPYTARYFFYYTSTQPPQANTRCGATR